MTTDRATPNGETYPECNGHGRIVNPWATEREALEGVNVDRCPTCGGSGARADD